MRLLKKSTRTLIFGGLFLILPVILVIVLWKHFFVTIKPLARTISETFELRTVFGPASILIVCIILLLFLCYVGGLLLEKGIVKKWSASFEKKLFVFFPSLQIIKFKLIGDQERIINEFWQAIIFKDDTSYKVAFITEKKAHYTTIYIPDAPKLDSGEVRYVQNDSLEYYPISMKQAMLAIYDFGEGLDIHQIITATK